MPSGGGDTEPSRELNTDASVEIPGGPRAVSVNSYISDVGVDMIEVKVRFELKGKSSSNSVDGVPGAGGDVTVGRAAKFPVRPLAERKPPTSVAIPIGNRPGPTPVTSKTPVVVVGEPFGVPINVVLPGLRVHSNVVVYILASGLTKFIFENPVIFKVPLH